MSDGILTGKIYRKKSLQDSEILAGSDYCLLNQFLLSSLNKVSDSSNKEKMEG